MDNNEEIGGDGLAKKQVQSGGVIPIIIIGILFFVFGFVTWLNGSLIPFLKIICHLEYDQALLVAFAFYISYTVMALPMSAILARTGYRNGMALGLVIMAIGAVIHIPAAYAASFPTFLVGLFTLGAGLTILQTASNPYIVLLGPIESAARRISIMGIINKGAGVVAPLAFAGVVLHGLGDAGTLEQGTVSKEVAHALAERLVTPYLAMAIVLAALGALARFAPLPDVQPTKHDDTHHTDSIFNHPRLLLGAVTLFFYMGMEVIAGDTIGLFGSELGVRYFATLTSYTMGMMVVGYALGIILIPRYLSQRKVLILSGVFGIAATLGTLASSPNSSAISGVLWGWSGLPVIPDPIFFVALMGLAHALVWPTVWPLAIDGLGDLTSKASAILIMAISGGAILPLLYGWLAKMTNAQQAYIIAIPCYAIIAFYGWKGCLMKRTQRAAPAA